MKKYFIKIFILLVLVNSILFSNFIKNGSLNGKSDGHNIYISWQSENENNLRHYEIERRTNGNSEFSKIAIINPKGSNYFYNFVDESAFKSTANLYQYRIKIVEQNNSFTYSAIVIVTHNVSSVKRTWGSLKAMFR